MTSTAASERERAEESIGAAARAISHEPALRYRGHLLHVGARIAPVRAPHVQRDAQSTADLRASSDATALRLLHSDPVVYARHRPEGAIEDLVYEFLEQFRVEALAPESAPGITANLRAGFTAWSDAYMDEGLLENSVGLLLFTVVHVCRSRVMSEPIDERINDHTEATRFGIYEILGERLRDLRPSIRDQEEFAGHAAAIARSIGDLAATEETGRPGATAPSTLLAMLEFNAFEQLDEATATGGSNSRVSAGDGYAVFTDTFDQVVDVEELVLPHARRANRLELDDLLAAHRPLGAYLSRSAQAIFPEPIDHAWESEQEEGFLDPRLLPGLVTGGRGDRIYRRPVGVNRPAGAVSVLIDCSGSMKGVMPQVAVLIDLLVRALDSVDVATEVLGYTTGAWSGGRPYRQWQSSGRPAHPGRLNETCHIVFKPATASWRASRGQIASLLWTPLFREGIDGEAVEWAYERLLRVAAPRRHLLVISDGSPMDGATSLTNDESYLDRHLASVIADIEARAGAPGAVQVCGLGIGHDMSAYARRSRTIDPDRILTRETAQAVLGFLGVGGPAGGRISDIREGDRLAVPRRGSTVLSPIRVVARPSIESEQP